MKLTTESIHTVFIPMKITFHITSQDELDKLGALMNHYDFTEALNLNDDQETDEMLMSLGADVNKYWSADISTMFKRMLKNS